MPLRSSLSKYLNTVTPLSVLLTAILFNTLPFIGFYLGSKSAATRPTLLNHVKITPAEAVRLVTNLPEVKAWLARFSDPGQTAPGTGGHPAIVIDTVASDHYVVHAYESVPADSHSATFNWYTVNSASGKITKEFN